MRRISSLSALTLAAALAATSVAAAQTVNVGLQIDPDVLDPHRSRTSVGRIVFASLCDKLIDVAPDLTFVPQLAREWSWNGDSTELTMSLRDDALFHDGTRLDAAAVKANLERAMTLPDSLRKSEIASVDSVEIVDDFTVQINLSAPDATLLAQLSDRAGMIMAPSAFDDFATDPVCSGPYTFVERVQNDRIALTKFDDHWDAEAYAIEDVVFLPIPDTTVRLANLQSGDLQILERLAPSDIAAVEANPALQVLQEPGLGYVTLRVNIANGTAAENPLGQDKRVRQAFELAIDRQVINQIVGEGTFTPAPQPFPPSGPYFNPDFPDRGRDVERARALLKEAGYDRVSVELGYGTATTSQQISELIQAMAAEAGFDVTLQPMEYAAMQEEMTAGNFQVTQVTWSGRLDPDGNIHQFLTCEGSRNDGRYCNEEVDRLLDDARLHSGEAERAALYHRAEAVLKDELPQIDLYYQPTIFALSADLQNFVAHPDGMVRLRGVTLQE